MLAEEEFSSENMHEWTTNICSRVMERLEGLDLSYKFIGRVRDKWEALATRCTLSCYAQLPAQFCSAREQGTVATANACGTLLWMAR